MTSPAILVPNAMSLTFSGIPKFSRLILPILLITVQSPSLHFFFQMLIVVLIKESFGYFVVNFLIAKAVQKSLTYRSTFFWTFAEISTWYFFWRSFVFCISSSALSSSAEITFLWLKLEHWLPEYRRFHPYFVIFLKNMQEIVFVHLFSQDKSHRIKCKSLILFLLITYYTFELHSNIF